VNGNRDRKTSGSTTSTTPPMEIVRGNQCDSRPVATDDGNNCTYESVSTFRLHTPQIRNVWQAPDLSRPRFNYYDDGPQPMIVEYEGSLRGEWLVPPSADGDLSSNECSDEPRAGKKGAVEKDPDGGDGYGMMAGGRHYFSHYYQVVPNGRHQDPQGW